jgi:hypothetical protein
MVDICAFANPISPTTIRMSNVAMYFFIVILFSPFANSGGAFGLFAKAKPHASI